MVITALLASFPYSSIWLCRVHYATTTSVFWSHFWFLPLFCFTILMFYLFLFFVCNQNRELGIGCPSSFHSSFRQSSAEWNLVVLVHLWARGFISPDWHIKQRGGGGDEIVRRSFCAISLNKQGGDGDQRKVTWINGWSRRVFNRRKGRKKKRIHQLLFCLISLYRSKRPSHDWFFSFLCLFALPYPQCFSSLSLNNSPTCSFWWLFSPYAPLSFLSSCYLAGLASFTLSPTSIQTACHSLLISIDVFLSFRNSFCRVVIQKNI